METTRADEQFIASEMQHVLTLLDINDDGHDCDSIDNLLEIVRERARELSMSRRER